MVTFTIVDYWCKHCGEHHDKPLVICPHCSEIMGENDWSMEPIKPPDPPEAA